MFLFLCFLYEAWIYVGRWAAVSDLERKHGGIGRLLEGRDGPTNGNETARGIGPDKDLRGVFSIRRRFHRGDKLCVIEQY